MIGDFTITVKLGRYFVPVRQERSDFYIWGTATRSSVEPVCPQGRAPV